MSGTSIGDAWRRTYRIAIACALTAALVGSLTACGSSKSSSSSSTPGASTTSASGGSAAGNGGADVATAKAGIAEFTGHPSPFPVTAPLTKAIPPGTKFVYLQASDPIGALLAQLLKPAVQTIGGKFISINAGATASSAQAAASSALALKPAVVLVPAFLPSEFGGKLQALKAAGAKIVGAGMTDAKKYGIDYCVNCEPFNGRQGKLLADWVVANKGAKANAAFYTVPELSFTAGMGDQFKAQMNRLCPKCSVRIVPVGVATIGSTAPHTIVTDLQSNPNTNVAVFSTMDMAQGLPTTLKSAGVNVTSVGSSPTPPNLQDIKAGNLNAGIGVDLATFVWEMVDVGGRLSIGQQPEADEVLSPIQVLEQKDITFNPQMGWSGYPDFAKRFAKLWHP